VQVVSSRDTIAYRTSTGSVYVARISDGAAAVPLAVDPYAADEVEPGQERRFYRSDAIAISDNGTLVSYSAADQSVVRYAIADAAVAGVAPVAGGGGAKRPAKRDRKAGGGPSASGESLPSPLQGTVFKVVVEQGAEVAEGDLVCVIEAMKMENEITAHRSGKVEELKVKEGDSVSSGDVLAVIK
jgi:biotin carboxyl carrier protein